MWDGVSVRSVGRHALALGLRTLSRLGPTGERISDRASWLPPARYLARGGVENVRRLGLRFSLDLDDNVQRSLFYVGTYEGRFLRLMTTEVRAGDVYVDVGGHIGIDALAVADRMKKAGEGHVFVFEPAADSSAHIRRGADLNGLSALVTVVECGLGAKSGELVLRADPHYLPGDAAVRSQFNEGEIVAVTPAMSFDEWCENAGIERVDLVKVDVEGAELDVIFGMQRSLRRFQPRLVAVEISQKRLRQAGHSPAMIDRLLADCGYRRSGEVLHDNVVYRRERDVGSNRG